MGIGWNDVSRTSTAHGVLTVWNWAETHGMTAHVVLPSSTALSDVGFEQLGSAVMRPQLQSILDSAISHGASDVHIRPGNPPLLRVSGQLYPLDLPALTSEQSTALVEQALEREADRAAYRNLHECDFALTLEGRGRFRVNAYRTRGCDAMVLRHVREHVPSLEELGLPSVVRSLALSTGGILLVCGPTGSGKSTSLAAMVDVINLKRRCHILTIEDPIEYLHPNKLSTVSQRELHTDTGEFSSALRAGLRQDPDVILIGEIRDAETLRTAWAAAVLHDRPRLHALSLQDRRLLIAVRGRAPTAHGHRPMLLIAMTATEAALRCQPALGAGLCGALARPAPVGAG